LRQNMILSAILMGKRDPEKGVISLSPEIWSY